MILELDCGNSRIKWRLLPAGRQGQLAWDQLDTVSWSDLPPLSAVRLASVADAARTARLLTLLQAATGCQPLLAQVRACDDGIICGYQAPERLGVDRWLAVLAAGRRWPAESLLVVDAGSAITVDALVPGRHLGGFIGPGLQMMRRALYADTGAVKVPELLVGLPSAPADHTGAAVSGALHLMSLGLVQQARSRYLPDARLVCTGGDGAWLAEACGGCYVPDLVLDGLACVLPLDGY